MCIYPQWFTFSFVRKNKLFKIPYCRTVFNFSCKTSVFFLLFYVKKKIAPIKNKKNFFQFFEQLGALFKKMTYFLVNFLAFFHAKLQLFAGLGGLFE